jgi:hypothetical protein
LALAVVVIRAVAMAAAAAASRSDVEREAQLRRAPHGGRLVLALWQYAQKWEQAVTPASEEEAEETPRC